MDAILASASARFADAGCTMVRRYLPAFSLGALLLCTPAARARSESPESEALPHAAWATDYLNDLGIQAGEATDLPALLEAGHVRVPLGIFDLRYPRAFLTDRTHAAEFQDIAAGIVEVQSQWIRWLRGEPEPRRKSTRRRPVSDAARTVAEWIDSWKSAQMVKAGKAAAGEAESLFLDPDEDVVAALSAFQQEMIGGTLLDLPFERSPPDRSPVTFVLAPTRREFLGLAAFVGSLGEPQRELLWVPTIPVWTEFRWSGVQVLALEYASNAWRSDPTAATPMDQREETGVLQHVLHHVTGQLVQFQCGERLDPAFQDGLDVEMVIELLGENNARVGGSNNANNTAARSKFVPGYTNGGRLPPINADSRWREDKGHDHFVEVLRRGLRDGRGETRRRKGDPPASRFPLSAGSGTTLVGAPFLGQDVGAKVIPEEAASDYREFFRAYRAAFVYWLRQESGDWNRQPSEAVFGELLASMLGDDRAFEAVVRDLYGIPFSAPDADTDSLEWRFLAWLNQR